MKWLECNITIRQAMLSDVSAIAREMLYWRQRWGIARIEDTPEQLMSDVADWLVRNSINSHHLPLYIAIVDDEIVAGCGGLIEYNMLPPYYPYVTEWIWWLKDGYTKRIAVKLWRIVEKWGKDNGAILSLRTVIHAERNGVREISNWRGI